MEGLLKARNTAKVSSSQGLGGCGDGTLRSHWQGEDIHTYGIRSSERGVKAEKHHDSDDGRIKI